jgi:hypothetical protein
MSTLAEQALEHTTDDANTAIVLALLDVAAAIREGNSIDVDIAEAINTPGGILDALAPMSTDELEEWAANLPAGPPRSLLIGLLEIKKASGS